MKNKNKKKTKTKTKELAYWDFNLKGIADVNEGRIVSAVNNYNQAITLLKSASVGIYSNLGAALAQLNYFDKAFDLFEEALKISHKIPEVFWNYSLSLLKAEEFKKGWKHYQIRWDVKEFPSVKREFPHKKYEGYRNITGKKLFLASEQGVGDEIMFLTILEDVLHKWTSNVVVDIDKRFIPLFSRSYPTVKFIEKTLVPTQDPTIDYYITIGDLPYYFRNSPSDFNPPKAYLKANPEKVQYFKDKYEKLFKGKTLIGLAWFSVKLKHKNIRLDQLKEIFEFSKENDIQFINLQYDATKKGDDVNRQINLVKNHFGVDIYNDDEVNPVKEFEDTAAQLMALDMVLSTSNTAVHLAGALGVETWVMLPINYDMRWGKPDREEALWYPNVKLFKSNKPEDWTPTINKVLKELKRYECS